MSSRSQECAECPFSWQEVDDKEANLPIACFSLHAAISISPFQSASESKGSENSLVPRIALCLRSHFGSSHFGSSHFGSSHFGSRALQLPRS